MSLMPASSLSSVAAVSWSLYLQYETNQDHVAKILFACRILFNASFCQLPELFAAASPVLAARYDEVFNGEEWRDPGPILDINSCPRRLQYSL